MKIKLKGLKYIIIILIFLITMSFIINKLIEGQVISNEIKFERFLYPKIFLITDESFVTYEMNNFYFGKTFLFEIYIYHLYYFKNDKIIKENKYIINWNKHKVYGTLYIKLFLNNYQHSKITYNTKKVKIKGEKSGFHSYYWDQHIYQTNKYILFYHNRQFEHPDRLVNDMNNVILFIYDKENDNIYEINEEKIKYLSILNLDIALIKDIIKIDYYYQFYEEFIIKTIMFDIKSRKKIYDGGFIRNINNNNNYMYFQEKNAVKVFDFSKREFMEIDLPNKNIIIDDVYLNNMGELFIIINNQLFSYKSKKRTIIVEDVKDSKKIILANKDNIILYNKINKVIYFFERTKFKKEIQNIDNYFIFNKELFVITSSEIDNYYYLSKIDIKNNKQIEISGLRGKTKITPFDNYFIIQTSDGDMYIYHRSKIKKIFLEKDYTNYRYGIYSHKVLTEY